MASAQYVCPNCGNPGPMAEACDRNPSCVEGGYHYIPRLDDLKDAHLGQKYGRYLITAPIGEGGNGMVYCAIHEQSGQRGALKLLADTTQQAVFQKEARALAQLNHRNIVRIYDFGQAHGQDYLVMEYIDGRGLDAFLTEEHPLSLLAEILEQVVAALGQAHRRGLIHRDIKPSNIMLQFDEPDRPFARIVDFGLAKDFDQSDQTTQVRGTGAYMAPEQVAGTDLGPWTDLYAVACVVYEVVTGQRAFRGTYRQVVMQKALGTGDPIAALGDGQPEALIAFLKTGLAHDPADRFRDAHVFRQHMRLAFAALGEQAGVARQDTSMRPTPARPPAPIDSTDTATAPPPIMVDAHRWRRAVGAVLVGALLLGVGIAFWPGPAPIDPITTPQTVYQPDATPPADQGVDAQVERDRGPVDAGPPEVKDARVVIKPEVDKAARDKAAREKAARDKAAREKAARDKAARDKAARDKAARDKAARDKAARDKAARDQAARDQAARDKAARDQAARDKAARDKAAREKAARKKAARVPDALIRRFESLRLTCKCGQYGMEYETALKTHSRAALAKVKIGPKTCKTPAGETCNELLERLK